MYIPQTQIYLKGGEVEAIIWTNDTVANPEIPSPQECGCKLEGEEWIPVMTMQLPAPKSVLHLVKCGCTKTRCQTARYTCQKAELSCTDICGCSDIGEVCDNMEQANPVHEEEEEEEGEDGDMSL
ncbi:UNVERIFIED_CONTAM: hypothetical protein FKN15_016069 [Acipenser sinensis]